MTQQRRVLPVAVLIIAVLTTWTILASVVLAVIQLNAWIRGFYAH